MDLWGAINSERQEQTSDAISVAFSALKPNSRWCSDRHYWESIAYRNLLGTLDLGTNPGSKASPFLPSISMHERRGATALQKHIHD